MTIDALPSPVPNTASPATFAADMDAFLGALPTFRTQANAQAAAVVVDAATATAQAAAAAAQAAAAAASADAAAASVASAAATAGVTKWVSGTTYAEGVNTWSPINAQTYRRIVAGAGTTDPSLDTVNWAAVGASSSAGASIFLATNFGGF